MQSKQQGIVLEKEIEVREWIARKESVCPYAPGAARFLHLPDIEFPSMEAVYLLARELKAFYVAKDQGKPVGRWMLMPHKEWQDHHQALEYSENVFWCLNAAYYHLQKDKKKVDASLSKALPGYVRGRHGEILNPVVGKLPNPDSERAPAKSLFCTALSPLYQSKQFYRYCPHSVMPLVYVSEFRDMKIKHPKATEKITHEMAYKGLLEVFGDDIAMDQHALDLHALRVELPVWGGIVDLVAEGVRKSPQIINSGMKDVAGQSQSNIDYFQLAQPEWIEIQCQKFSGRLPILSRLCRELGASAKDVIGACFLGSGLYVIPESRQFYSVHQR